jgi:hypothetical protein
MKPDVENFITEKRRGLDDYFKARPKLSHLMHETLAFTFLRGCPTIELRLPLNTLL